eukprot:jgi/Ulvmu1/10996/UM007_0176.1
MEEAPTTLADAHELIGMLRSHVDALTNQVRKLEDWKAGSKKSTRRLERLKEKQRVANRVTPWDAFERNAYVTRNCDALPDTGVATCSSSIGKQQDTLAHAAVQPGTYDMCLLPLCQSVELVMHAAALSLWVEQRAATCAAAAVTTAWNVLCGRPGAVWPPAGCTTDSRGPTEEHSFEPAASLLRESLMLPSTGHHPDKTAEPECVQFGKHEPVASSKPCAGSPSASSSSTSRFITAPRPVYEQDILNIFSAHQQDKVAAAQRAVGRALGCAPPLRHLAAAELHSHLAEQLFQSRDLPKPLAAPRRAAVAAALQQLCSTPHASGSSPGQRSTRSGPRSDSPVSASDGSLADVEALAAEPALPHCTTSCSPQPQTVLHAPSERPSPPACSNRRDAAHCERMVTQHMVTQHDRAASGEHERPEQRAWATLVAPMADSETHTEYAAGDSFAAQAMGSQATDPPAISNQHRRAEGSTADGGGGTAAAGCALGDTPARSTLVSEEVLSLVAAAMSGPPAVKSAVVQACTLMCKHAADLQRLQHPVRPTTAPIGNERLMAALRTLARVQGQPVTVRKLLARSGAPLCVAATDDTSVQATQWEAIVRALKCPTAALIFHLENHYSVIYGARAWETVRQGGGAAVVSRLAGRPGKTVRQVLVGKPGQQPSRWMPWEDVRACLLAWKGYAIMVVKREADGAAPGAASAGESRCSTDDAIAHGHTQPTAGGTGGIPATDSSE